MPYVYFRNVTISIVSSILYCYIENCVNCKCGKPLKQKALYTRDGVIEASHFEFRCSAASRSKKEHCKSGYYYGYCNYSRYKSSILNILA